MKRKVLVLLALSICCLAISNAQDPTPVNPEHLFGIYTGYSHCIIRDEVASPLIYSGGSYPVLITYDYHKGISRHAFSFSFGTAKLYSSSTNKSGINTNYADNVNALLGYTYSRNTNFLRRFNINCYWGFTFLSLFNYRSLNFYSGNHVPFFEQVNNLGASLLIEKKFGSKKDNIASFKINIPFVAYAILNERYNAVVSESLKKFDTNRGVIGKIITNGEFVTFNKLFEFQTELFYTKFLNEHIGLKFEHQLHFYSIAHYQNLLYSRYLSNQYLVGLIIKI